MPMYAASTSTGSANGGDGTVFKITLEKQKEQELRRVRGVFNFEEMVSIVRHMWNSAPKRLSIEYVDEDGDRVRVGSELEWAEALKQSAERGERTFRLFARRGHKGRGSKKAEAAESGSDSDAEEADVATPVHAAVAPKPAVPALDVGRMCEAPATNEANAAATDMGTPEATGTSTEGTPEHEHTIDLLSRLFDCDAAKEMQDMFSRIDFAPVVTRKVDAVANEVVVDVDKAALRHLTVTRTNLWIGNGLYEKAESTLDAAMLVWPEDSLFEYNAACSASLRGDLCKAVELLREAVRHGYRNVQQLKSDPDLENVRGHPDFGVLLRTARGEIDVDAQPESEVTAAVVTAVAPATVAPAPAASAPAAAVAPARTPAPAAPAASAETDVDRLLAVFPHMTAAEAAAVLRRCGNLTVAVNHCLANM